MTAREYLYLSRISRDFGGVRALVDVDLSLAVGEIHCLVGENGSGKSTLIKIIAGVERPEPGGVIRVDGVEHSHLTPAESTRLGIQVIYQDLSLFPHLSVAENIAFRHHVGGLRIVDWAKAAEQARTAMARVGVSLDLRQPVSELPIAQRRLVAICRAIGSEARLIIMDEPTASLTKVEVSALLGLARQLSQKEITILFVSHKLNEVLDIAERVTILRDGRKIGVFDAREMTDRRLATLMTGREFVYEAESPPLASAPTVLSVRGLTRRGEFSDISFDVRAGEIVGLTGLLGAGRTELAVALFGLSRPESGEVLVDGVSVPAGRNSAAIARGVAYIPEDRIQFGLVMEQPTATNVVLTILDKLTGRFGLLAKQRRRDAAARWIDELGIKVSDPESPVKNLSGGNQQRVVLAKWLATAPHILILDNPTVGVDVRAKDGIYAIIRRMAASGKAIILISDEILEVLNHAHRILIMREGRITASLLPTETTESDIEAEIGA
jgi:simple sugar transport system ATP-binding protein